MAKEELAEGKAPLTYINTIEADFEKVSNYLQKDPVQKVKIYLVNHDIWGGSKLEYGYWIENTIVTTPKEVESGNYLASIISVAYGIESTWLAYGLAGAVNEISINKDSLKSYYLQESDFGILGLSDFRFLSICDGEEIQIARETAISLFRYMTSTYGQECWKDIVDVTSNLDMYQVKNDWLQQMKVSKKYENLSEGAFEGYKTCQERSYDLHVEAPYADFYFKMNIGDETCYLTCAENLEKFLYKNKVAVAQLKDYIREQDLDDLFDINRHITYYIGEKHKICKREDIQILRSQHVYYMSLILNVLICMKLRMHLHGVLI